LIHPELLQEVYRLPSNDSRLPGSGFSDASGSAKRGDIC
jgi:hypothetical protein